MASTGMYLVSVLLQLSHPAAPSASKTTAVKVAISGGCQLISVVVSSLPR